MPDFRQTIKNIQNGYEEADIEVKAGNLIQSKNIKRLENAIINSDKLKTLSIFLTESTRNLIEPLARAISLNKSIKTIYINFNFYDRPLHTLAEGINKNSFISNFYFMNIPLDYHTYKAPFLELALSNKLNIKSLSIKTNDCITNDLIPCILKNNSGLQHLFISAYLDSNDLNNIFSSLSNHKNLKTIILSEPDLSFYNKEYELLSLNIIKLLKQNIALKTFTLPLSFDDKKVSSPEFYKKIIYSIEEFVLNTPNLKNNLFSLSLYTQDYTNLKFELSKNIYKDTKNHLLKTAFLFFIIAKFKPNEIKLNSEEIKTKLNESNAINDENLFNEQELELGFISLIKQNMKEIKYVFNQYILNLSQEDYSTFAIKQTSFPYYVDYDEIINNFKQNYKLYKELFLKQNKISEKIEASLN